jgi:hypothetical protein
MAGALDGIRVLDFGQAIENSSMMIPKVNFYWMSVSAIQNHLRSYCAAT